MIWVELNETNTALNLVVVEQRNEEIVKAVWTPDTSTTVVISA